MSSYGKVKVKDGKYRVSGDFHSIEKGTPIRNENDNWNLIQLRVGGNRFQNIETGFFGQNQIQDD